MPLLNKIVAAGLRARLAHRVRLLSNTRHWTEHSAAIQTAELRRLVGTARNTWFGRRHAFAKLAACGNSELVAAYRQEVPIAEYTTFRPLVERMRVGGEPDVLWPGLVRDFAQTSGTTAGDKYIPVSDRMMRSNYLAALDIFANAWRFGIGVGSLLGGRVLFLGGSTSLETSPRGIRTGDLSGVVAPLIRWPLSSIYSPGRSIALMSHWPSKIDAMARAVIDQDVRMISGMPSWMLVLFERMFDLAKERGRPVRMLRDLWPNLRLLVHGGVKFTPFEPRIRQAWSGDPLGPDVPHRLELYPASEGFIAIQDTPGEPGLRLLVDRFNFYEFVPLESIDNPGAPAFTCDQVEKGQRYVVTMSTCAGLWRYVIGDVVEFDSVPLPSGAGRSRTGFGPCRLRIVGRHRHFVNAFGENLIIEHIENAVASAARDAGLVVGEFTAAPVYPAAGRRAGLELAVEFECKAANGQERRAALDEFRDAFDAALKAQNVDYTTKRTGGLGMAEPTITPLRRGTFHRWLLAEGKLGGQHKCPRCANSREVIDRVLAINGADQAPSSIP